MNFFQKHSSLLGFLFLSMLLGIFLIFLPVGVESPGPMVFAPVDKSVGSDELPNIKYEEVAGGLQKPWDLDFLPDSTIIYTEKDGTLSILKNSEKKQIHTVNNIFKEGEGGLLGLAVDAQFESNRFIYACYDTATDIRVSRWKLAADASKLEDQVDIVTGISIKPEAFFGRHSGCQVEFSAFDNSLWIGTGDVAEGTFPQDPKVLAGKILHVDRDGKGLPGNLSEPFDERIFSYGHRNTQGIALFGEPKNGSFGYSVEHGSKVDDEVNELKGGNFGWDPIPGYNETLPMTDFDKFPDAIGAIWSSGDPTVAPSGAEIVSGNNWKIYNGSLAVAVLKEKHLMFLRFNTKGQVISEQRLFKNTFGRIRSVNINKNSELFITTDNGKNQDKIIKISAY